MLWHASVFHFSFVGEPQKIMLSLRSHTYKAMDYMIPLYETSKRGEIIERKSRSVVAWFCEQGLIIYAHGYIRTSGRSVLNPDNIYSPVIAQLYKFAKFIKLEMSECYAL